MSKSINPMSPKLDWIPPAGAVTPANAFHTLYMRMAEIGGAMLLAIEADPTLICTPEIGELMGACAGFSNEAGKMAIRVERIRRKAPRVYEVFEMALNYTPQHLGLATDVGPGEEEKKRRE